MNNIKFTSSRLFKPTQKDIERNREKLLEYERLGIRTVLSEGKIYTDDEFKAMRYINSRKPIPKDLEQRLLSTKEQRLSRFHTTSLPQISEEELEQILR